MLLTATYVLRPLDRDFFRTKLTGFYAEEDESLDIVGLGSSALYRYVNAPLLWGTAGIYLFYAGNGFAAGGTDGKSDR